MWNPNCKRKDWSFSVLTFAFSFSFWNCQRFDRVNLSSRWVFWSWFSLKTFDLRTKFKTFVRFVLCKTVKTRQIFRFFDWKNIFLQAFGNGGLFLRNIRFWCPMFLEHFESQSTAIRRTANLLTRCSIENVEQICNEEKFSFFCSFFHRIFSEIRFLRCRTSTSWEKIDTMPIWNVRFHQQRLSNHCRNVRRSTAICSIKLTIKNRWKTKRFGKKFRRLAFFQFDVVQIRFLNKLQSMTSVN